MQSSKRKRIFSGVVVVLLVIIFGYIIIRPFHLRWGATDTEVSMTLPGDLNGRSWTRAITVNAPPEEIYPWLLQWGQGRGGWYSYDWLENILGFNIHTADRILPEFQNPAIGDPICMTETVCTSFINVIEPGKYFGWQSSDPEGKPVWNFLLALIPKDSKTTRLIIRESFDTTAIPGAVVFIIEIPDVVMELKALDTVKQRAEGIPVSPFTTVLEIITWFAALIVGVLSAVWFVGGTNWLKPLVVGVLSITFLLILTFLFPPLWLRVLFDLILLVLLLWAKPRKTV